MTNLLSGEVLCMTESQGMTVTAHTGTVWVTEQGVDRDEAFGEAAVSLDS